MTDPAITAAIDALFASTPPPVTVWGIRYAVPAGHICWGNSETEVRAWLAEEQSVNEPVEVVSITGHVRVHHADATATSGGAR